MSVVETAVEALKGTIGTHPPRLHSVGPWQFSFSQSSTGLFIFAASLQRRSLTDEDRIKDWTLLGEVLFNLGCPNADGCYLGDRSLPDTVVSYVHTWAWRAA